VKNIIRQNKKSALQEFLFGSSSERGESSRGSNLALEEKIERLQNQLNSLQARILDLETKLLTALPFEEGQNRPSETPLKGRKFFSRVILNSTLKSEKSLQSANLLTNDSEVRNPTYQRKGMESKSVSDDSKSDSRALSNSERYNLPSNQDSGLNETNFITLGKISEEEKIEIIQTGFQRQAEGIISLKKYYESTDPNSLFQLKGYSIKYETIRRTQFYQNLK
jgi:hypothetical protein